MIAFTGVATMQHFVWLYLFVVKWQLDVVGIGLSTTLTFMGMLIVIEVYSNFYIPSIKESLFLPGHETLQNWVEYLRLGIPAAIML